jgi:hypothetical protein
MRITLTFTPQRVVNGALLASALGAVLCLLLLLFAGRRAGVARPVAAGPSWISPLTPTGDRPRVLPLVAVAVAAGVTAGLVDRPLVGAGIALVTAAALLLRRGPGLLAAGGVASLAGAAAFTVAKQWRNHYPADFGWPGFFAPAHHLALAGLLLMLASVAVGATRRRAGRRARGR